MKTSIRLNLAVKKLYLAFYNDELHPECCKQCAVGNILDNTDSWKHLSDNHGDLQLNYVGLVHQNLGRKFNGYTPLELLQIEATFLKACGYQLPLHHKNKKPIMIAIGKTDKNMLFNGLTEVITLLCELDGVSNIMDYTRLFEFKSEQSQLAVV